MRQASATVHATLKSHLDLLPTLQVAEAVYDVGTAEHCSRVGYLYGAIVGRSALPQETSRS